MVRAAELGQSGGFDHGLGKALSFDAIDVVAASIVAKKRVSGLAEPKTLRTGT